MPFDTVLVVTLGVLVLVIAWMVVQRAPGLTISVFVGEGRQVTIGGEAFPPTGPAKHGEGFPVPKSRVTVANGRVNLTIDTGAGLATHEASMEMKKLRTLSIDASIDDQTIVYGGYDTSGGSSTQSYALTGTKCVSCGDEFYVCGVNPQCR